MRRARRRERDVPAKGCCHERTRIVIASTPDPGTGGWWAARCAVTRKDFDDDHAAAATRARRTMIGRGEIELLAFLGGELWAEDQRPVVEPLADDFRAQLVGGGLQCGNVIDCEKRIEIDDAYLGGERNGGKRGRGSPGKTPIVAAVETTPEGKPIRLKLRRVKGFRRAEIATLAQRNFHPASTVVSDGLRCFTGVGNAGCVHQPMITGPGRKAALNPAFKWVNTTLGNIKSAITGTYRAICDKHAPRYLAEFEYRFNRRYDLAAMMPRLGYVAVRTPPMPYRLLKLAEDHA